MDEGRPRIGGVLLLAGVVLFLVGLATDSFDQGREAVLEHATRWTMTHTLLAGGLLLVALGAGAFASREARATAPLWKAVVVCAQFLVVAFAWEASFVRSVAADAEVFEAARAFTNLLATALAPLCLAVAGLAVADARGPVHRFPTWVSWTTVAFSGLAAIGVLGEAAHVPALSVLEIGGVLALLYLAAIGGHASLSRAPTP